MVLIIALVPYLILFFTLVGVAFFFTRKLDRKIRSTTRWLANSLVLIGIWLYLFGGEIPLNREFDRLCREQAGYEVYEQLDIDLDSLPQVGRSIWDTAASVFRIERGTNYIEGTDNLLRENRTEYYYEDRLIAKVSRFSLTSGGLLRGLGAGKNCPENTEFSSMYLEIFQGDDQ